MHRLRPAVLPLALAALLVAVAAGAVLSQTAAGFGTVNIAGQNAEHERMTRLAVQCGGPRGAALPDCFEAQSLDQLAGRSGTFGAVGIPDVPIADGEEYHCDNGDHLAVAGYPRTPANAAQAFISCRATMEARLSRAVQTAKDLLDGKDEIVAAEVKLPCSFPNEANGPVGPSAKCRALADFGIALHIAQDFYAHSNWADQPDPARPVSETNPPGLGNTAPAPFMDLRGSPGAPPAGLISGCFVFVPEDAFCTYNVLTRAGPIPVLVTRTRVRHKVLNKDEGPIDPATGAVGVGVTARGRILDNFKRAVLAATADTADKWATFRQRLESAYGARRAARMVCALTRDDPLKDCAGLRLAVVIDSSGSNIETDPQGLRLQAAQSVVQALVAQAERDPAAGTGDPRVAVVAFSGSATLLYPLGDPAGALGPIGSIGAEGGTSIASGILAGVGAVSTPDPPARGKAGLVVLTDGQDQDVGALVSAINGAGSAGMRVSFGFLSPPSVPFERPPAGLVRRQAEDVPDGVQDAILASGGVFATIGTAADQRAFTDLVQRRGLAASEGLFGTGAGGPIALNLEVGGRLGASGADVWVYSAGAGEQIEATLRAVGAAAPLRLEVRDPVGGVGTATVGGGGQPASVRLAVPAAGAVRLVVDGPPGRYALKVTPTGGAVALARPAAGTLAPVRTPVPPLAVSGLRVSATRRGPALRRVPRGVKPFVTFRFARPLRRALRLQIALAGPRRAGRVVVLRAPRGARAVTRRLPLIGSRRGTWTVALSAGGSTVAAARVPVG